MRRKKIEPKLDYIKEPPPPPWVDFLYTYGWAIVVVIIAIMALGYFGVLDPSNFQINQTERLLRSCQIDVARCVDVLSCNVTGG